MRKITALTLVLIVVLASVSLTSCGNGSKGLEFELNEDKASYTVVGQGTCTDTELVIPQKYEGLPVTAIADNAFKMWRELTSVSIPSSVKTIGEKAFYTCDSLTTLEIEGDGTVIGFEAFRGCSALSEIVLPEGVTEIGDYAFAYCADLESFTFPSTIEKVGERVFENCKDIDKVLYTGTKEQWRAIEFHKDWRYTTIIVRVYCSDGVITFD